MTGFYAIAAIIMNLKSVLRYKKGVSKELWEEDLKQIKERHSTFGSFNEIIEELHALKRRRNNQKQVI